MEFPVGVVGCVDEGDRENPVLYGRHGGIVIIVGDFADPSVLMGFHHLEDLAVGRQAAALRCYQDGSFAHRLEITDDGDVEGGTFGNIKVHCPGGIDPFSDA